MNWAALLKAIAKGYIQKEIQDSAYKWQMDVEKQTHYRWR